MATSSTQSEAVIMAASAQFGTIDYSRWQAVRWQWWSYIRYPRAGTTELNFFGQVAGQTGVTMQDTNLPKAGSFGQTHFLLKTISTDIRITNNDSDGFTRANQATLDTQTLASDYLNGFVQAGLFTLNIGARPFATVPKPFLYLPPPGNEVDYENSYANQILAVPTTGTTTVVGLPWATQIRSRKNVYITDPNILIEAEQQFNAKISFPSGIVPVIASNVVNDSTNPLKIGVIFDGVLLRPMQ
jgi:hypothetical protein